MSLIFYYGYPAVGHINPTLPVLRELIVNGHHVVAYNSEETRAKFEAIGAEFRAYPELPEVEELVKGAAAGNFAKNAIKFLDVTRKLVPRVLVDLQDHRPDAVIYDSLATWGRAGAEKLNLKTVALISTFAITPPMIFKMMPFRALFGLMAQTLPGMPFMQRKQNAVRREFDLPAASLANPLLNTGQLNIVFTTQELQPMSETLGDSYRYVGASVDERDEKIDFTLDTKRPVVYISLGTINNQNFDFYRQCFEAFATYPAQFVLSAGKQTDIKTLGPVPSNFIVRNFVAQLDLLKRTSVYISHAGMNSVHESLYHGVPLLLVPQQSEQLLVALQVQKLGAGEAIGTNPPFGKVSAAELRAGLERIMAIHRRYKSEAERLGKQIKEAGGAKRAAHEIIGLIQK